MPYCHTAVRIHEIVEVSKALADGESVSPKEARKPRPEFRGFCQTPGQVFLDIRFEGVAGADNDPSTYDAAFRLDQQQGREMHQTSPQLSAQAN